MHFVESESFVLSKQKEYFAFLTLPTSHLNRKILRSVCSEKEKNNNEKKKYSFQYICVVHVKQLSLLDQWISLQQYSLAEYSICASKVFFSLLIDEKNRVLQFKLSSTLIEIDMNR